LDTRWSWSWICTAASGGGGRAIALKATGASVDDAVNDTVDGIFDVGVLAILGVLLVVEERRQLGLDWRLTTKHDEGTVVVAVIVVGVGVGRAIPLKATDASGDDTVDGIFDMGVLAVLDVLVVLLVVEERRQRGLDWRLTTKHDGGTVVVAVVVVVVGGGRAIALKATDASVDDTVVGIFDVGVLVVLAVLLVVEERRHRGLDWRLTTKHGEGTVVVVVVVGVGRAIALKATDASVDDTGDDTVDGIFDVGVLAVVVVLLVVEERRQLGLDWRLTTKHGEVTVVVAVVVDGGGRAIALKATDASVDGTVDGIFDIVLAVLVLVVLLVVEERRQLGLDWRLTTKHGEVTVVVAIVVGGGGRAIALKATDASADGTVDGIFDVVLAVLVLVVPVGEERRQLGLDWRLTTEHGGGTVVVVVVGGGGGVGRAIALKATDASVDDTVIGLGLGLAVRNGRVLRHWEGRR